MSRAADFVVEQVEAEGRLRLRPAVKLPLKVPDLFGCWRLTANHLHVTFFESAPEVRVLPSTGITRPQQSYDPVRRPLGPPPGAMSVPRPPPDTGLLR